jgi:hypothetical protein
VRASAGTYTTVSAVCASPLLGSLVDLDVLHDQVAGVETLGVGIGLSVLEKTEKELGGLDGPAGLGDTESLAYVVISQSSCPRPCSMSAIPYIACSPSLFLLVLLNPVGPLTLRSAASAASVPPHGHGLLLLQDIAEEGEGTLKLPSVDGLSRLAGVLERGAEVAAASPRGLCVVDGDCCVADLRAVSRSHSKVGTTSEVVSGSLARRRTTYHRVCGGRILCC